MLAYACFGYYHMVYSLYQHFECDFKWFDGFHWRWYWWWLMDFTYWMMSIVNPEIVLLDWPTLIECWILKFVIPCFPQRVKPIWPFHFLYHFEIMLCTLTCFLIPFMSFFIIFLEVLTWERSREMVEGEVTLNTWHLGRLPRSSMVTLLA